MAEEYSLQRKATRALRRIARKQARERAEHHNRYGRRDLPESYQVLLAEWQVDEE